MKCQYSCQQPTKRRMLEQWRSSLLVDYLSQHQVEISSSLFAFAVSHFLLIVDIPAITMSFKKEPTAKVLQRLFLAVDAALGQTWLNSVSTPVSLDALHCLVLDLNIPLMVKARSTYGNFCTASQMNKVPGPYWKPEPKLSTCLQAKPFASICICYRIPWSIYRLCIVIPWAAFFWWPNSSARMDMHCPPTLPL
jgi:hypothetical protein